LDLGSTPKYTKNGIFCAEVKGVTKFVFHGFLLLAGGFSGKAQTLDFQSRGNVVAMSHADKVRVITEIEALVVSSNFDSVTRPQAFRDTKDWFDPAKSDSQSSFLHLTYDRPQTVRALAGPLVFDNVYVRIPDGHLELGPRPGPITLLYRGKPIFLSMESGLLEIKLGLDPTIFPFLASAMQATLEKDEKEMEAARR